LATARTGKDADIQGESGAIMTNTPMSDQPNSSVAVHEPSVAARAKDAQTNLAGTAQAPASAVAAVARENTGEIAQDAKTHARQLVNESRQQLRGQANEQAQRVAATLGDIGRQLGAMARGDGAPSGAVADLTQQLASSASGASEHLQERGFDGVVEDTRRFARNRPGLFLLAATGAGFAIGRVLRSADTQALIDAAKPTEPADSAAPQLDSSQVDLREQAFDL
jgi:hypothetical protein